ncbi:uncharacterized protein LOC128735946 [Sabethes cyaneus]|uniref:uncharacterized protein LOC128735946 n=1 Tax=Sabethes cyaneus TaxID=53552 RepID=UPI00237D406E|nr:uncharacterized protein LOC128735946 [Sabethes cyaneus]
MEISILLAQYQAMNVTHLMVDELEYELRIRGLNVVASRTQLERVLRNRLKEEKEQLDVVYKFVAESVESELKICYEILNEIRGELEKKRVSKAPEQKFKTRLIHVFFRMERLKPHIRDEDDLNNLAVKAGNCLRLLSVYFSVTSHLPAVRAAELALINESLNQMRSGTVSEAERREEEREEEEREEEEREEEEREEEVGNIDRSNEEEEEIIVQEPEAENSDKGEPEGDERNGNS